MQDLSEKDQIESYEEELVEQRLEEETEQEKRIRKEVEKLKKKRIKALKKLSNPAWGILILTGGTSFIKDIFDSLFGWIFEIITVSLWGFLDAIIDILKGAFDKWLYSKLEIFKVAEEEVGKEIENLVKTLKFLARYLPFLSTIIEMIPFLGEEIPAWSTSSLIIVLLSLYISSKARREISRIESGEKDEELRTEVIEGI